MVVNREERGGMMTEYRSDMVMMMVVPTQIFSARNESSLWLMFPLSN